MMLQIPLTTLVAKISQPESSQFPNLPTVPASPAKIQTILSIVFIIVGAMSVIIIVIAGIKYMLSQGDPQEITKAKNTIIYALVGLIIAILSATIVRFTAGYFG